MGGRSRRHQGCRQPPALACRRDRGGWRLLRRGVLRACPSVIGRHGGHGAADRGRDLRRPSRPRRSAIWRRRRRARPSSRRPRRRALPRARSAGRGLGWAMAYPVAVGVTAAGHGIALEPALHAFLHAVAPISFRPASASFARPERRPARTRSTGASGRSGRASGRWHIARRCRQRAMRADLATMLHENPIHKAVPIMSKSSHGPLRVGVGGPVGSARPR